MISLHNYLNSFQLLALSLVQLLHYGRTKKLILNSVRVPSLGKGLSFEVSRWSKVDEDTSSFATSSKGTRCRARGMARKPLGGEGSFC